MNGLLAAMAVANPVITALLTITIFLEKDKIKKRSEDLEASLRAGNQELVQTVIAQKENFENIGSRIEILSKTLEESSGVSAKSLNDVTAGLKEHALAIENSNTALSKSFSKTANESIEELATKTADTLTAISQEVNQVQLAQVSVATAVKDLQETLKNTVSL